MNGKSAGFDMRLLPSRFYSRRFAFVRGSLCSRRDGLPVCPVQFPFLPRIPPVPLNLGSESWMDMNAARSRPLEPVVLLVLALAVCGTSTSTTTNP